MDEDLLGWRCPECQAGKHDNCDGTALNPLTDEIVECPCTHQYSCLTIGCSRMALIDSKDHMCWLHSALTGADRE